jgi:hypothetical protein
MTIRHWAMAFTSALLASALTAAVLTVTPVDAARDDALLAGRANGAKGYLTSLYSTNPSAALRVVNNRTGGAPALDLQVKAGPALTVNTPARIMKLNADYVDGMNAAALQPISAGDSSTDLPDGTAMNGDALTATFDLPGPGMVLATGNVDLFRTDIGSATIGCSLVLEKGGSRAVFPGSRMYVLPARTDGGDDNRDENCGTSGAISVSESGTYSIHLAVSGATANDSAFDGQVWAIFVPGSSGPETGPDAVPESAARDTGP